MMWNHKPEPLPAWQRNRVSPVGLTHEQFCLAMRDQAKRHLEQYQAAGLTEHLWYFYEKVEEWDAKWLAAAK